MTPSRSRLMAKYKDHDSVEVARLPVGQYFTESGVRALTGQMGPDWRTWLESPMRDHDAMGRRVEFTPKLNSQQPAQRDTDLEIEEFTAERVDFEPIIA